MQKIVVLTPCNYLDHCFPIMKELNKSFNLKWIVVFQKIIPDKPIKYYPRDVEEYSSEHKINVKIFERKNRIKHFRNINVAVNVMKEIRNFDPDVLYIETFDDPYIIGLCSIIWPRRKTIIGIHDVIPHVRFEYASFIKEILNRYQKVVYTYFHLFSKTQKIFFDNHVLHKKSFCIPLPLLFINGFSRAFNVLEKKSDVKFLFWGEIRYNKGVDIIIRAANVLCEKGYQNFSVTIAGQGPHWAECERLIKYPEKFSNDIRMIPNELIPILLRESHFLVLPYRDVTQSGPLMFALNYNCPAIVSDHSGFKEYIEEGNTGFVFENENIDSLCQALIRAINLSEENYGKMKKNLFNFVEQEMSMEKLMIKYQEMFDQIIKTNTKKNYREKNA